MSATTTPEEMRVTIATACGWTKRRLVIKGAGGGTRWPTAHGIPPGRGYEAHCPDYLRSLDAMHSAEEKLTGIQLVRYIRELRDVCWSQGEDGDDVGNLIRATAAQRAEAFVRVVTAP